MVLLGELHEGGVGDSERVRWVQPVCGGLGVLLDRGRGVDRQHLERVNGHQDRVVGAHPRIDLVPSVPLAEVVHHQALVDGVHHYEVILDPRQRGVVEWPQWLFRGALHRFLGARLQLDVGGVTRLLEDACRHPTILFVANLGAGGLV